MRFRATARCRRGRGRRKLMPFRHCQADEVSRPSFPTAAGDACPPDIGDALLRRIAGQLREFAA